MESMVMYLFASWIFTSLVLCFIHWRLLVLFAQILHIVFPVLKPVRKPPIVSPAKSPSNIKDLLEKMRPEAIRPIHATPKKSSEAPEKLTIKYGG